MNRPLRILFSALLATLAFALVGCPAGDPGGTGGAPASTATTFPKPIKLGAAPANYQDVYISGAARGSIAYTDATNKLKVLAPSTAGLVLSTNGAGADPTWISSGGTVAPGTAGQIYQTNAVPATNWVTVTGDTTISSSGVTTTAKANGASVPAAGALTTGNVLQVTGASALGYAAVNLAGGASFVTGALPLANLATGSANTVLTGTGSTSAYSATPTATAWLGTGTVSTTGLLRGANAATLVAAKTLGGTDLAVLATDSGNQVTVGDATNSPKLGLLTSNGNIRITTQALVGGTFPVFMWDLAASGGMGFGTAPQSGTNLSGNATAIFGGLPTGNGVGGGIYLQVSQNPGSTGTTVNTYNNAVAVISGTTSNTSFVGINKGSPTVPLDVIGAIAGSTTITAATTLASSGNITASTGITAGTTIDATGNVLAAQYGAHSGNAFGYVPASLTVNGGAQTVSVSTQGNARIKLTGTIASDAQLNPTAPADGTEIELDNQVTSTSPTTAQYVTNWSTLWIPPGIKTRVYYDGGSSVWKYAAGSGGDVHLTFTDTVPTTASTRNLALFKAPASFVVTRAYVRTSVAITLGTATRVTASIGTASAGTQILLAFALPTATTGNPVGSLTTHLGADMTVTNAGNQSLMYGSATTFFGSLNSDGTTSGRCAVTYHVFGTIL